MVIRICKCIFVFGGEENNGYFALLSLKYNHKYLRKCAFLMDMHSRRTWRGDIPLRLHLIRLFPTYKLLLAINLRISVNISALFLFH